MRWVFRVALLLLSLPLLLIGALFAGLNTDVGQRAAPGLVAKFAGPMVEIKGFSGRFPDRLRLASVTLSDAQGVWATAHDISLDWSPSALLSRTAHIDDARIGDVTVTRLPVSSGPTSPPSNTPFALPVRVEVARLRLPDVAVGESVAGTPIALSAEGFASGSSLADAAADLSAKSPDGGAYAASATLGDRLRAKVRVTEPAGGLLSRLASLPALGGIAVKVDADGPRTGLPFSASVAAGELRATASGTADLDAQSGAVTVDATAPAMAPADGLSWRSVAIHARAEGTLVAPEGAGHIAMHGFSGGGAAVDDVEADVTSDRARAALRGTLSGLVIPGPHPDLLRGEPVRVEATAGFGIPHPVTLHVTHPLLDVAGQGMVADKTGFADVALADLRPLGPVAGTARAHVASAPRDGGTGIVADATVRLTEAPGPAVKLIGDGATLHADVVLGDTVRITAATLDGAHAKFAAHGDVGDVLDLFADASVDDLSLIRSTLHGATTLTAHARGPVGDFAADASLKGEVTAGIVRGQLLDVVAHATGLPAKPEGAVTASGLLDGAPVALDATVSAADGIIANVKRLSWKSVSGQGHLAVASGAQPVGALTLDVARLADLRPFADAALTGAVKVAAQSDSRSAMVNVDARGAGIEGSTVAHATIVARATGLDAAPAVDATATLDGIAAQGATGNAKIAATGPQTALAVTVTSALRYQGVPTPLDARAVVDVPGQAVRVSVLTAGYRGETVRLAQPVRVEWAPDVAVDRLRLLWRQATVDVAGKLAPDLDATATVRGVDFSALKAIAPDQPFVGTLEADAKLRGKPGSPDGTMRLAVRGARALSGPARALPPASLEANATLAAGRAQVSARAMAGPKLDLTVSGGAPLGAGPLDLRAAGAVDLALLNPVLSAGGQRVKGAMALDLRAGGTTDKPVLSGMASLTGGEAQDVTSGVNLTAIAGAFGFSGDCVAIDRLSARAGPGTITVKGQACPLAPSIPVDLAISAKGARPVASDTLTATLDADLQIHGATGNRALSGTVAVTRADIRLPERLPISVATLDVRKPGDKPQASAPPEAVALQLAVSASQVFVRGRGLDAEVAGELTLKGTTNAPDPRGAFTLRRGNFSLAGQSLEFSKGEVSFNGGSLSDPSIDFEATNTQTSTTATLAVTGTASAPKVALSAVPDLPQDEILAKILFGQSVSQLNPFQIAQIAATLASLTGSAPGGGLLADPLGRVRSGLGLDRLSVGGGSGNSSSPSIEAGRYVAPGVFVGAKQGTSGGTQATVQVDLYRGLKLESAVGTGGGAVGGAAGNTTAADSNGSSIGLTYQFEY